MSKSYTNHLIHETSPYLLQHAHNPVAWYPWSQQALDRAKLEDKPILVSIGYAACHWCHVMEKESFEDEATASIMNTHFINIKIDREERPDLDHIYMNAVQTMTGSGGWPLNVFLTPDTKPFYGGTYFPPTPIHNRPSWTQILLAVADAFKEKREAINGQAESLTQQLQQSVETGIAKPGTGSSLKFDEHAIHKTFQHIMAAADRQWGGFGNAPKFPQTFTIQFLFRYYHFTGEKIALDQALLSLDGMIYGGIYDQLGGGFARYTTDREWLVPHFEKMLYDNALLMSTLAEAYQVTHNPIYADTARHTFDFLIGKLMGGEGGFFSAIDADSEGIEGKYYVWNKKEIEELLKEDSPLFCAYYGITDAGNWEGQNILHIPKPLTAFAASQQVDTTLLQELLDRCRIKLMDLRDKRIPPLLDTKVLLGWNALMNTACSKAFAAFGDIRYKEMAIKNMDFLLTSFRGESDEALAHTYQGRKTKSMAFIDDYAYLIQALINLQEITGNQSYLLRARTLASYVEDNFSDKDTGLFFYTHRNQKDVIVRIKEIYDGAVPSGNAIMAWNLHYLSLVFDVGAWRSRSVEMVEALHTMTVKYPTSFGAWACILADFFYGINEVAVVGDNYNETISAVLNYYLPNKVLQSSMGNNESFPLLSGRLINERTLIYLCRGYSCLTPVESVAEFMQLIEK